MSVNFEVVAQPRSDTGKGASRRLRREGLVPAILYGGHQEPEMLALAHNQVVRHLQNEAFYSHVLSLKIGDATIQAVLKDLQRHPAKPFILHMDFLRVTQDEKIRMVVPLHFVNEEKSKAIKLGGNVSHHVTEVEVSCLPKDLPEFIAVDLLEMGIGDILHLSEIPMPEGVTLAHTPDPDEPVIVMHGARSGEQAEGEDGGEEGA
jgi:large subunit ribosomal protein L25